MQNIIDFFQDEFPFYIKRLTKKYYIIRRSELGAGFFSNYLWVLGHVVFAKKLGYIPVVDMQNYPTLYSEKEPVEGIRNAWNYYFEDVDGVSLEEAYKSNSYVLAKIKYLSKYSDRHCNGTYRFPSEETINFYNPYIKKNIRIRRDLLDEFEKKYAAINSGNGKVLGVHIRGTDMKNNLGHPMPEHTERYLQRVDELLKSDGAYETVYLATDEIETIEYFQKHFNNSQIRLVFQDAFRIRDNGQQLKKGLHETEVDNYRELHRYRMGLEVLEDAYFLSKCDSLVCGHSNITNVAVVWNNKKYESIMVLENE